MLKEIEPTDPELLAAASTPGGPDRVVEAVVAVLRRRRDPRTAAAEEIRAACCKYPGGGFAAGAKHPLATGKWWGIFFSEPTGRVVWVHDDTVTIDYDEDEEDESDIENEEEQEEVVAQDEEGDGEYDEGSLDKAEAEDSLGDLDEEDEEDEDEEDEDEEGHLGRISSGSFLSIGNVTWRSWLEDPKLCRLRPDPSSDEFRRLLNAAFAEARQQLLLGFLEIEFQHLHSWSEITDGNIKIAIEALCSWANEQCGTGTGPAAQWLIYLAGRDPGRYAALMAHVWSVPDLHVTGYRVLDATRRGWTEVLPGLTPLPHVETVDVLVRRGAGDAACAVLDAVLPGWQAELTIALMMHDDPS